MYKVTKRDCPMFGIGPYVCEFICDTASDIATLPTSISEGTGGRTAYDNQKCASGSIANVAENGAESKQYMLNNQDIWCPYSVAAGSSDSVLEEAKAYTDSEIADLINGAPTTRDTLKEIADAMDENQTVVEALDAAIGSKANKTDIPTKVSQLENDSGYLTEHQDLSEYAKKTDVNAALGNKADISHTHDTYASKSLYSDTTINTGRKAGTTVGVNSTAEGTNTTSSSHSTHAEGIRTTASGGRAHAEGMSTTASGNDSHAEGCETTASGHQSHAEGYVATSSGDVSHAEGWGTTASARNSHAEGYETTASGIASHAEGYNTTASGDYSHAEGSNRDKSNKAMSDRVVTISDVDYTISGSTAYGINSHAEGAQSFAYGYSSHAEGHRTTAIGDYSHAEGNRTTAVAASHAEGAATTASGSSSHAEGSGTTASGSVSHAEGYVTTASGNYSHAEGYYTTATNYTSHVCGHYNVDMTTGGSYTNTTGTAFAIGNGIESNYMVINSNAFSVMFDGTVKAKSTITASTTADYAEFFEWLDGNPNEEDRVGYFVTMDGDKIRIANADDDYILGVVSGEPFVLGNGDCDTWNGMFLHDEFRRTIYEPAPKIEEILDDDGNPTGEFEEIEGAFDGIRPKLNPEYDNTKTYISRFDRPEWAPIGMLGVLAVRNDGTAKVNGYVTIADGGIATACDKNAENSYRVIKANTDSVVEIIFR